MKRFWAAVAILLTSSLVLLSFSQAEELSADEGIATLKFVGDIHNEAYIKDNWSKAGLIKNILKSDLTIGNLESAVTSSNRKVLKEYNFKTDISFLYFLKDNGIDAVTIANNHAYDYGLKGFQDTIKNLESSKMDFVGGGRNLKDALKPLIYNIKNNKIAVFAINDVVPSLDTAVSEKKAGVLTNKYIKDTTDLISKYKDDGYLNIVYFHSGVERNACPSQRTINLFNRVKAAGASIILASHPHVLEPVDISSNVIEAYSLGNFIFYSSDLSQRMSMILEVKISKNQILESRSIYGVINKKTGFWGEITNKAPEFKCKINK